MAVFPGRGCRHAPGPVGPQVFSQVHADHRMPVIKLRRSHLVRIIPALPETARSNLPGLPAQVGLLQIADLKGPVAQELRVPLGHAQLPRHAGTAEGAFAQVPAAVHGPVPGERCSVLAEEHGFRPLLRPVLEPVGQLLDGGKVRVEVDGMHRAEVARRVVVDDPARIDASDDGLGPQGQPCVVPRPGVAAVVHAVDQVGVHVLIVAGGVVAGAVEDHRGMAAGHPGIVCGMAGIAVIALGVGRLPVVMTEMRLGERHQHAHVVGRPEDLAVAQVRARIAIIVVRVHKVDTQALEPLERLARPHRSPPPR